MQTKIDYSRVAEIRLSYLSKVKASERRKISCSKDCYSILLDCWDPSQLEFVEEFKVLLLNRASKVLGIVPISKGGIAGTVCDPKLIFAAALKASASSLILAHNHPSGNLQPSQVDLQLTTKLKEGRKFLDLPILDHLIIAVEGYYSFADEGIL